MKIELEKNIEKLKEDIDTLQRAIKAVLSSPEFRSLFGKTQFLDSDEIKGLKDINSIKKGEEWTSRRTRGDHSINVAAIATKFIEKLYNEEFKLESDEKDEPENIYTLNKKRAMLLSLLSGYSHDLGHTPFGHDGESAISEVYKEYQSKKMKDAKAQGKEAEEEEKEERRKIIDKRIEIFGEEYENSVGHPEGFSGIISFEHIDQSYINFLNIINREKVVFSDELLETVKYAILAHSRSRIKKLPTHLKENDLLVVHAIRTADKGDYQIVDGEELEELMEFPSIKSKYANKDLSMYDKINIFIDEWVRDVQETDELSDEMVSIYNLKRYRAIYDMWAILYCEINAIDIEKIGDPITIENMNKTIDEVPVGIVGMFKGNKARNKCIVKKLMSYYLENYNEIPQNKYQKDTKEAGYIAEEGDRYRSFDKSLWEEIQLPEEFIAIGFVTSLTNSEAKALYEKLVKMRIENGPGVGIEPIEHEEINKVNRQYTLEYINEMYKSLAASDLSADEKKELEIKLRVLLLQNKSKINSSLKDKGYMVTGKAKTLRIQEKLHDEELYEQMIEADAARARKGMNSKLKYPNLANNDENPGSGDER